MKRILAFAATLTLLAGAGTAALHGHVPVLHGDAPLASEAHDGPFRAGCEVCKLGSHAVPLPADGAACAAPAIDSRALPVSCDGPPRRDVLPFDPARAPPPRVLPA